MPGRSPRGHQQTLVVGAGLTGAALSYICARSGFPTVLVSVDRPASQGTALAVGTVHGLGPPGERAKWTRLPPGAHQNAAARTRRGYELLQEVLLRSPRPVGLTALPHELHPSFAGNGSWMEKAAALLEANGWPTRLEERAGAPVLVRRRDAVLSPRRLTFELLRQARDAGARIRLGIAYRGVREETPDGLVVELGGEVSRFGRVFWAGGRLGAEGGPAAPARTRLVLHQVLSPGSAPLTKILELGEAELTLAPAPLHREFSLLVRMADEDHAGGSTWPETPAEWTPLRGRAVRQRLAEAGVCYGERGYQSAGPLVAFGGLVCWPICSILGAALEAVESPLDPGTSSD